MLAFHNRTICGGFPSRDFLLGRLSNAGVALCDLPRRRRPPPRKVIRMPKHGSWLDMAESELAVLSTQCLSAQSLAVHAFTSASSVHPPLGAILASHQTMPDRAGHNSPRVRSPP